MTNVLVIVFLASSKNEQTFESFKDLILQINIHVDFREYAFVLLRTKKNINDDIKKEWLICDRKRKTSSFSEIEKRHIINKHIACFFSAIIKLVNDYWLLKIVNFNHNHSFSLVEAHSIHRKIAMKEIQNEINRQLRVQITSVKILINFRIIDLVIDYIVNSEDFQLVNSMFRFRDIYIYKTFKRREIFESLIFIRTLIRKLNDRSD
jgi:hypothetical protein